MPVYRKKATKIFLILCLARPLPDKNTTKSGPGMLILVWSMPLTKPMRGVISLILCIFNFAKTIAIVNKIDKLPTRILISFNGIILRIYTPIGIPKKLPISKGKNIFLSRGSLIFNIRYKFMAMPMIMADVRAVFLSKKVKDKGTVIIPCPKPTIP